MTIWERLGIGRTEDIKVIKRAYAKQLKIYHPEDDPAGYQALREAFDAAMSYAKRRASMAEKESAEERQAEPVHTEWTGTGHPDAAPEQDEPGPLPPPLRIPFDSLWNEPEPDAGEQSETNRLSAPEFVPEPDPENTIQTIAAFLEQAAALYDDFPSRISPEKWVELLDADVMWNMDAKPVIGFQLLKFMQSHRYLPAEIWRLLENSFGWLNLLQESEQFDNDPAIASFLVYYKRQLADPGLRYQFLLSAEGIDIDKFLHDRDQGQLALVRNDLKKAMEFLKQAYAMFPDDPDLLRLLGEFYLREGDKEKALAMFERLVELAPGEIDGYLYRARIWRDLGHPERTVEECRLILSRWPNRSDIAILMAQALQKLGNPGEAAECLEQAIQPAAFDSPGDRSPGAPAPSGGGKRWKLFFNRPILLNLSLALILALSLIVCLYYYRENVHNRTPETIAGAQELIGMDEQRYAELTIKNVTDIHMGKYLTSDGKVVFQNEDYAFINFDYYENLSGHVFLGEFSDKQLIILADYTLGLQEERKEIKIRGYVHHLDADMETAVSKMLQWKPVSPADSTERILEAYQYDIHKVSSSPSEVSAASVPKFQPVYFEVAKPQVKSEFTIPNLLLFGFLSALWIYSLYRLAFEYRKVRLLIAILDLRGQNYAG
ncbi:tetratricopeptide repeat protein [Paenibacillus oralis]|uniref:Tetratricopeptide repeat protein n=1 Tax=Paenibacillus oralis TaxID=2490856 RepID=A0A3P3U1G3_9BACL|nr:J domain-containing protein [Paenibacillus oralis]RRJ63914.1 tetratricopeptide repeat protein [Paenibacillus oralis]